MWRFSLGARVSDGVRYGTVTRPTKIDNYVFVEWDEALNVEEGVHDSTLNYTLKPAPARPPEI